MKEDQRFCPSVREFGNLKNCAKKASRNLIWVLHAQKASPAGDEEFTYVKWL